MKNLLFAFMLLAALQSNTQPSTKKSTAEWKEFSLTVPASKDTSKLTPVGEYFTQGTGVTGKTVYNGYLGSFTIEPSSLIMVRGSNTIARLKSNSDTLEIFLNVDVRFIKLFNQVYEMQPNLQKVEGKLKSKPTGITLTKSNPNGLADL